MSKVKTSKASGKLTSSPGSAAGPLRSRLLGGPKNGRSGAAPVHASRSPSLVNARGRKTSATSGLTSFDSSASVVLQSSLASRLQARMGATGSMEYVMTWKEWATKSGLPICALRARARKAKDGFCVGIASIGKRFSSERPTSDSAFSGWPTPQAGSPATEDYNEVGNTDSFRKTVALVSGHLAPSEMKEVRLSGWGSPSARDWKDAGAAFEKNPSMVPVASRLPRQAMLAGWPTARQTDGSKSVRTDKGAMAELRRKGGPQDLDCAAHLAGWITPSSRDHKMSKHRDRKKGEQLDGQVNLVSGTTLMFSHVPTKKRGVLSPEHSRWLMGFPPEWASCAPTETRSTRGSRPSSSKRT